MLWTREKLVSKWCFLIFSRQRYIQKITWKKECNEYSRKFVGNTDYVLKAWIIFDGKLNDIFGFSKYIWFSALPFVILFPIFPITFPLVQWKTINVILHVFLLWKIIFFTGLWKGKEWQHQCYWTKNWNLLLINTLGAYQKDQERGILPLWSVVFQQWRRWFLRLQSNISRYTKAASLFNHCWSNHTSQSFSVCSFAAEQAVTLAWISRKLKVFSVQICSLCGSGLFRSQLTRCCQS